MIDQRSLWGPNGNTTSFVLVFSIALAITSIPVNSRIMHDLGILDTPFARVVLGVAVLEDLVLYVVLATAIGLPGRPRPQSSGCHPRSGSRPAPRPISPTT
jgi:Kef-type K+ transport system membrane component KefB